MSATTATALLTTVVVPPSAVGASTATTVTVTAGMRAIVTTDMRANAITDARTGTTAEATAAVEVGDAGVVVVDAGLTSAIVGGTTIGTTIVAGGMGEGTTIAVVAVAVAGEELRGSGIAIARWTGARLRRDVVSVKRSARAALSSLPMGRRLSLKVSRVKQERVEKWGRRGAWRRCAEVGLNRSADTPAEEPEEETAPAEEEEIDDETRAMQAMMGFGGFGTTKVSAR